MVKAQEKQQEMEQKKQMAAIKNQKYGVAVNAGVSCGARFLTIITI